MTGNPYLLGFYILGGILLWTESSIKWGHP